MCGGRSEEHVCNKWLLHSYFKFFSKGAILSSSSTIARWCRVFWEGEGGGEDKWYDVSVRSHDSHMTDHQLLRDSGSELVANERCHHVNIPFR